MRQKNQNLYYLKMLMCFLNFLIICFLSITILVTTVRIEKKDMARDFLDHISYMPREPVYMIIVVFVAFFLLLLAIEYHTSIVEYGWLRGIVYVLEIVLCLLIIHYLYIGYNGIILLVIADIATSIKYKQRRMIFFLIMSIIFIFSDYNLVSIQFPIISFQEYLSVYSSQTMMLLLGIRNVLVAVNIAAFGLYMIILMQNQMKENARIALLNVQLQTANDKLKEMNVQLQDYASMQEKMGETKERNRVAREIHDTLGHTMTGLSAGIDACITLIDISVEATKEQLKILSDVARQGIKDIRRSVNKLRPDALEHLGLMDSIEKMIHDTKAISDVEITFDSYAGDLKFNVDEEEAIYRVVQESITNAIRHGKAMHIRISINRDHKWLVINIRDDGKGCETIEKGFGLIHMEERLQMLHGTLSYSGGDGFHLEAKIPIRWGENYD